MGLFVIGCVASAPSLDGVVLDDPPINVPGTVKGWRFYTGTPMNREYGLPQESHTYLIAVRKRHWAVIDSASDFEPYIDIDTPDDALAFVRSFTMPDTHYLLRDIRFIEVRCRIDANSIKSENDRFFSDGRMPGELWHKDCQAYGVQAPTVRRQNDSFIVSRFVIDIGPPDHVSLYRVVEEVTTAGRYVLVEKHLVASDVDSHYPVYY